MKRHRFKRNIESKNLRSHKAKILEINKNTLTVKWNRTGNISKIDIVFILHHYEISNHRQ